MKKSIRLTAVAALAAAGVMVSAGAANFTGAADRLHEVGLFQGTGVTASGAPVYELDRTPTRAEAAVMLVRLLGKEADAKALTYTAPFTDLEGWEAPYVQYLYDNKLTTGATATTFEPKAQCSAQMYTTFLLRSLGYSDAEGGDFKYSDALGYAENVVGLIDDTFCDTKNFKRDNVAAMSLEALGVSLKESNTHLIDKLIADGAIDKTKAKPLTDFISIADEYNTAAVASSAITRMEQETTSNIKMNASGVDITAVSTMNTKAHINTTELSKSQIEFSGTTTTTIPGSDPVVTPSSGFYTNGAYYMTTAEGVKVKMDMDLDAFMQQIGDISATDASYLPLCFIDSAEKNGTSVTVTYDSSVMDSLMQDAMGGVMNNLTGGMELGLDVSGLKISATVKDGKITGTTIKGDMTMELDGEKVTMSMDVKSVVKATGDSVKLNIPTDLSGYVPFNEYIKDLLGENK